MKRIGSNAARLLMVITVVFAGVLLTAAPASAQCTVDAADHTVDGEFDLEGYLAATAECAEVLGEVEIAADAGDDAGSGETLAITGRTTATTVGYAAALVLVGGALVLTVRRKTTA